MFQFCEYNNGHLVHILSELDQHLVEIFLQSVDPERNKAFWIGLNDLYTERQFFWEPGHITPNYTKWEPGQPNHLEGHHFATIWTRNGTWNDYPNSSVSNALCELEVTM